MKFEYDGTDSERDCVAYIDGEGDLIINGDCGDGIFISKEYETAGPSEWEPEDAAQKFYPGDKITITF